VAKKITFVGFRGAIAPITPPGSTTAFLTAMNLVKRGEWLSPHQAGISRNSR